MGKLSGDLKKSKEEITITYMMMCIVTIFVITQFPGFLHELLLLTEIIKPAFNGNIPVFSQTNYILMVLNSTINTIIYCIFNTKFRDVLYSGLKGCQ